MNEKKTKKIQNISFWKNDKRNTVYLLLIGCYSIVSGKIWSESDIHKHLNRDRFWHFSIDDRMTTTSNEVIKKEKKNGKPNHAYEITNHFLRVFITQLFYTKTKKYLKP